MSRRSRKLWTFSEPLKKNGKILYYGVSNFNVEMMEKCRERGNVAANQVGYNLFDRRMEKGVLPYCLKNDIGFMAYGTLAYGYLLTGTLTPETTFPKNDWRRNKQAFGLPLFQEEQFLKELQVGKRLTELAKKSGKIFGSTGYSLGAGPSGSSPSPWWACAMNRK